MQERRRGLTALAALLALPVVVLTWWFLRSDPVPEVAGPGSPVKQSVVAAAPHAHSAEPPLDYAHDGVPIMPAGTASARGDVPMHPHGVTPQHERIYRENSLIGKLNGAMDVKDGAGLRRLLKEYREGYPEDAHVLQEGYELIANCLERPGAETRAVAQRYYDEQLDSGLRRYIRRHCLEASN